MRALFVVMFLVVLAPVEAQADFDGRVVNVHDGDTVTILVERTAIRVRLDSIDAPELKQAFGRRSRQSLADLCTGKPATVVERGKDRYGRAIGSVSCAGVEANGEQVRRGMAWVYVKYAPKASPLFGLEHEARSAKRGLWVEPAPTPPWEWRKPAGARVSGVPKI